MNGGTIENCSACNLGGAVNIRENGSFSMTGGTIKNCTVDEGGSGNAVYGRSDEAIVAISGGTIENAVRLRYRLIYLPYLSIPAAEPLLRSRRY